MAAVTIYSDFGAPQNNFTLKIMETYERLAWWVKILPALQRTQEAQACCGILQHCAIGCHQAKGWHARSRETQLLAVVFCACGGMEA